MASDIILQFGDGPHGLMLVGINKEQFKTKVNEFVEKHNKTLPDLNERFVFKKNQDSFDLHFIIGTATEYNTIKEEFNGIGWTITEEEAEKDKFMLDFFASGYTGWSYATTNGDEFDDEFYKDLYNLMKDKETNKVYWLDGNVEKYLIWIGDVDYEAIGIFTEDGMEWETEEFDDDDY